MTIYAATLLESIMATKVLLHSTYTDSKSVSVILGYFNFFSKCEKISNEQIFAMQVNYYYFNRFHSKIPKVPKYPRSKQQYQLNNWKRLKIKSTQNTWILNNYLIDILVVMLLLLLTIDFYTPLWIHCTKLLPHLSSLLQNLAILKIEVFQSIENFENRICDVNYFFLSQCRKNYKVDNNFVWLRRKFCDENHNFVSQCRNFWELNYNFLG